MKTKRLKFVWIDEYSGRKQHADNIRDYGSPHAKVDFVNVSGKSVLDTIYGLQKKPKPDLVIIDHILNQTEDKVLDKGSQVAELLREKWPTCPIVGVTGAEKRRDITFHQESLYEDLYSIDELTDYYNSLYIIGYSFRYLSEKKPGNIEQLIRLFGTPEDDISRLSSVIPENIKNNFSDKNLPIRIFKWFRHKLFSRPGFLYDKLWMATFLGIKEDSFDKVKKIFKGTEYNGIFANYNNEPRWWKSKASEILYRRIPSSHPELSWELGRKLPKITKKDYSKCQVCCGKYDKAPEIVGFVDVESKNRRVMHLRCSGPHPKFEQSLYFDEIRMTKTE